MTTKVYKPTLREEFLLWLELGDVQLGMDLISYYGICCVVGYFQGYYIGSQIVRCLGG